MKNHTRQMVKEIIQENAVGVKDSAAKLLYCKVAKKLEEQYKAVSQNIFKTNKQ